MIDVLIVDDHDLVRLGLSRILEDVPEINIVGQAESGEAALKQIREVKPDIILMDILMPGIGGLEATRRICRQHPNTKIVVVTTCDDDVYPARLLQAGAAGYLTKGADLEEMVNAIKLVHEGQRYISPDIAHKLALKSFSNAPDGALFDQLSERELQIAMMIVNCHKVSEIANALCLSPKTVNTYRYRIFAKLEISSDVELTLLAMQHGLIRQAVVS